jgi:hypothetical protein
MQHLLRWWYRPAKVTVTVLLLGWVAHKLHGATYQFQSFYSLSQLSSVLSVLAALLLLPLNVGLEARKWQLAMRGKATFLQSLQAVLVGGALGILTPNRLGDYFGRSLVLQAHLRVQGGLATFGSRISQLPPLAIGMLAAWPVLAARHAWAADIAWVPMLLALLTLAFTVGALAAPIWLSGRIVGWLGTWPRLQHFLAIFTAEGTALPARLQVRLLVLGMARYSVFVVQFALLMAAFGAGAAAPLLLVAAALVFGLKALIPGIALAELGIRESLALLVAGWLTLPQPAIFNASLLLMLINLVVPALLGLVVLPRRLPQPAALPLTQPNR